MNQPFNDPDSTEIAVKKHRAWVFRRLRDGKRSKFYFVKARLQNGKQWMRCTNCARKGEAIKAGRALFSAALEGNLDVLLNWQRREHRRFATIGELLAAHELGIDQASSRLRDATGGGYRRAMRRLVAWALGLHVQSEGRERRAVDEEAVGKVSASELTAEFVDRFEAAYLAPHRGNPLRTEQALRSAHTVLRNAKSLFGRRAMKCYAGMTLPDLSGFLAAQLNEAEAVRHRNLDDEAVAEMARAAEALRAREPSLYLVHLLARHCALRPSEIEAARVNWLRERRTPTVVRLPDNTTRIVVATCVVEKTDHYDPKGSSGEVPISADVWDELLPWIQGRAPDDWLVPAANGRARTLLIYRRHADFVRPWTQEHQKRSYELRRWAATKVAKLHGGLEMAERFIRHAPRTVAALHYITELSLPAPITLADCGLAEGNVAVHVESSSTGLRTGLAALAR